MILPLSDQLVLKSLSIEDAPDIFRILDTEREYMRVWLPFVDKTLQVEDSAKAVLHMIQAPEDQFSIRFEDRLIGLIGYKDMDTVNRKIEIGYWLSQNHQGKGIMTQSVKMLLRYAFTDLEMNRVQIRVAVGNDKSNRIPKRLEFVLEGVERDGELLSDNKYTDINVYSMLMKEYKERIWK